MQAVQEYRLRHRRILPITEEIVSAIYERRSSEDIRRISGRPTLPDDGARNHSRRRSERHHLRADRGATVSTVRTFAALISPHGVTLVEHQRDRDWVRAIGQWTDHRPAVSVDEAITRLTALLDRTGARKPRLAVALEQFGVIHHLMTLPNAADAIIEPIVRRELHRVFNAPDPVIAFTRDDTASVEPGGPRQIMIAGAPPDTVDALRLLESNGARIEIATVVPKAMHSLYELGGASKEPTAVLICLESGPHLAFFLDGRLELAIGPPMAPDGDRPTLAMILDQLERGAVYFREEFGGAEATRVLLAAHEEDYTDIAHAIESRVTARVKPLFKGAASPEAVVAIGAALEAQHRSPLDLFPHRPTAKRRARALVTGPGRYMTTAVAAAAIALVWGATQVYSFAAARRENARLRETIAAALPATTAMRAVAQRRADRVAQAAFVRDRIADRSTLTGTLAAISANASESIALDTVHVRRADDGWSATVEGTAHGASTTQAVFGVDALLKGIRALHTVSVASLDDFAYSQAGADSLRSTTTPVTIAFHLSFTVKRAAGDSAR